MGVEKDVFEYARELVNLIHRDDLSKSFLIGAGVSVYSGIPTTSGILDEIIKIIWYEENPQSDKEPPLFLKEWYSVQHQDSPTFPTLVNRFKNETFKLWKIFESNRPSLAHFAIADMCSRSKLHQIITTNYDRLLEKAMYELDVFPIVIVPGSVDTSSDSLNHNNIKIIKVCGDYRDKNLRFLGEAKKLDLEIKKRVKKIFDESDILIIIGWSGIHDQDLFGLVKSFVGKKKKEVYIICPTIMNPELSNFYMVNKNVHHFNVSAEAFFVEYNFCLQKLDNINNIIKNNTDNKDLYLRMNKDQKDAISRLHVKIPVELQKRIDVDAASIQESVNEAKGMTLNWIWWNFCKSNPADKADKNILEFVENNKGLFIRPAHSNDQISISSDMIPDSSNYEHTEEKTNKVISFLRYLSITDNKNIDKNYEVVSIFPQILASLHWCKINSKKNLGKDILSNSILGRLLVTQNTLQFFDDTLNGTKK